MSDFMNAIDQLTKEKGISKDVVLEAIEAALIAAYKKEYKSESKKDGKKEDKSPSNVRVSIDRETGEYLVYRQKTVVEEVEDDFSQISLEDALNIDPRFQLDDIVEYEETPEGFGRVAAQAAKQKVMEQIREAERNMIFDNYSARQGELVTGVVQRISNQTLFVNIGSAEGILVGGERAPGERYKVNDRIKVYIYEVKKTAKGPQIFLSRTHPGFVERLFELEVPEIEDGDVVIKSIAREAGSRTKIAVFTEDEDIDPVGACVGQNGTRVKNIVDELWGEKIDITTWSDDPEVLISNVLSPAKVEKVIIDEEEKSAMVVVPDYQLSLAIGKEGQNVRLAARLCGWKIDIKSHSQYADLYDEFEEEFYDDEESYEMAYDGDEDDVIEYIEESGEIEDIEEVAEEEIEETSEEEIAEKEEIDG